ncbi:MAG: di-trans,poly-cis-decaprenylcistransferase [Cyanobacteria bacterium NC_groundwater_1444_Ag_S-0.65um_54_12]|nr:di-trans,poly-cis-decaprenylcistransferase [Cyanobacteria bacterium NC_groundwater_1444_Ag_S-0.65um_54_12]
MDGNRRWALARQLPGKNGHRAGRDTLRELVKSCLELGIPYLTVFAFSTENWKRSADEIGFLWVLLRETLEREAKKLCENDVRLRFIGEIGELAPDLQVRIRRAEGLTATSRSLTLNIALNYGGRREIVAAARQLAQAVLAGELAPTQIDESVFSTYLYTKDQPDPDLLIRTSGEFRISNYLLWQLAYAEIYVTKALWPDFNRQDLCEALLEYQRRDRRFGARP